MSQNLKPGLTPIEEVQYCAKHPNREASLRCIRCDRLMCTDCIVRTSVGYVCKECSRRQEDKFFDAGMQDYVLQAGASFIVMAVVCAIFAQTGFVSSFLAFILGPIAGGIAGEAAMRVTGRRRGRYTDRVGTVVAGIGGLIGYYAALRFFYLDVWFLIFLGLALGGAYARLRGRI